MFLISGFYDRSIARQIFKENDISTLIELYCASIMGDFLTIIAGILVFVVVLRITENQETSWSRMSETEEGRMPPLPLKCFPTKLN